MGRQDVYSSSSFGLLFLFGLKDPRSKSASGVASMRGGEGDGILGRLVEEEAAACLVKEEVAAAAFFAAVASFTASVAARLV
mgnify:CR=1 FL=1